MEIKLINPARLEEQNKLNQFFISNTKVTLWNISSPEEEEI